ncbi:MAG: translation elongation factor Ts [Planctomycetia bacterium]
MADINPKLVMDLRAATGLPMMQCKQALVAAGGNMEKAIEDLRKAGLKAAASKAGRTMAEGVVRFRADGAEATAVLVRCETEPVRNTADFKAFADKVLAIAHARKPADVAALKAAPWGGPEGATVADALGALIAKIGENMDLGGVTAWTAGPGEKLCSYVHHDDRTAALARLVVTKTGPEVDEVGKQLCQHIVFSKPVAISRDQIPADQVAKEREILAAQVAQDPKMAGKPAQVIENVVKGKVESFFKEKVLPDQGWYVDEKQSVASVLKSRGATVKDFVLHVAGA